MIPEITNNPPQPTDSTDSTDSKHFEPVRKLEVKSRPGGTTDSKLNTLSSFIFYLSILFFIIGFNFSDVMIGNWQQQFLPDLGGRTIVDITFTDSLNGFAVTSRVSNTSYVLKTTNKGDDWSVIYNDADTNLFTCIQFLNQNTGYVGGLIRSNFNYHILKTTNGGANWLNVSTPGFTFQSDIHVLNEDTIWFAMDEASTGGVFFTSNGGVNWLRQATPPGLNPDHIYMYNSRIGFAGQFSSAPGRLFKTTNSGMNWFSLNDTGFTDMYFSDSLTGWKSYGTMKKTTDGGLNWVAQTLPSGGNLVNSLMGKFSNVNRDTIWGVGGQINYAGIKGIIYKTTNGGINWGFQLPDTSIHIFNYYHSKFVNKLNGWAYAVNSGIHTTTGGDTTVFFPVNQISSEIPKEFKLEQNYPNPFNPATIIRFQINRLSDLKIVVYDIQGRQISELVNQKQNAGTYEVNFNGSNYSSGVYFYSLIIDGIVYDTKRMLMIK